MPKIIESLEFNSAMLKNLIETSAEFDSLSKFAEALGSSKQMLHFWLENEKMPTAKLYKAVNLLTLTPEKVSSIIRVKTEKQYQVLFRTRRNVPVMISNKARASKIAREFFDWHEPTVEQKKKIEVIQSEDPIQFAHKMQKRLDINDCSNLTTASLVKILEKFNIHVLFVDFDEMFNFKDIKKNVPCAFCVKEEDKYVIVVNLREPYENMLWIIIHELTHIFAGHLEKHADDLVEDEAQEKFSNKVAVEFMTPTDWFQTRKTNLISKYSTSNSLAVYHTEEITRKLNASFMGVILALSDHQIISSHTKSYLMKVHHNKKDRGDFHKIYQVLGTDYDKKRLSFWKDAFKNNEALNYLKFQSLIRKKTFENFISTDRLAEIFGLSEIQIEKLKGAWLNEVSSDL